MEIFLKCIFQTARSATIEIADGSRYETGRAYEIFLDGKKLRETRRTINLLTGLCPDTEYRAELRPLGETEMAASISFRTEAEFVSLNVRDFGAAGDGVQDDTRFIQAAILACPPKSRVLIPEGIYLVSPLFLKSGIRVEIAKGAVIQGIADRSKFPLLPGVVESRDRTTEYYLGTWEGNPLPSYASIITGIDVSDVVLYGEGVIDGGGSPECWYDRSMAKKLPGRPRSVFLVGCTHVVIQGLTVRNSPAWTIHPYFTDDFRMLGTSIQNPYDSPNTDGFDPESCDGVEVVGVHFSVGDDCIAVKSGKIYMGRKSHTPCRHIHIRQCLMENGHGGVTTGSEIAGGVTDLLIEDCIFRHTDRGFRVKTRRGRGKNAILQKIVIRNVQMTDVYAPIVVNSFYFCDPDGKTQYVQSREPFPVDDRTPEIRDLTLEHLHCEGAHACAGYISGLPEKPVEKIVMNDVRVTFAENPEPMAPAMSEGVEPCVRRGFYFENVKEITARDVTVEGCEGEVFDTHGVGSIEIQ